jgi:nucleoside-diphosphate-sugar epimerase
MRVFVTGATGFIGSATVADLIAAGHEVLGLTRSEEGARALAAAGAEPHRGSLEDLESLKRGAAESDGVIHLAFNHDFSRYVANCEDDRRAIEAMGSVLVGSGRPLLVTSGTAMRMGAPGELATEADPPASSAQIPRAASEEAVMAFGAQGVSASVVRLPQVHDTERHGLVSLAIETAREKGVSAYVGEGRNRWPAAHRTDVARLYRLALEKAESGVRYHAVAEEGVAMRDIAEAVGRRLGVPARSIAPEAAPAHFGFLAAFASLDLPASSVLTRQRLGWRPTAPGMIADLDAVRVLQT